MCVKETEEKGKIERERERERATKIYKIKGRKKWLEESIIDIKREIENERERASNTKDNISIALKIFLSLNGITHGIKQYEVFVNQVKTKQVADHGEISSVCPNFNRTIIFIIQ